MNFTCFGEYLLRLSPPGAKRILQADSFDIVFGGAEANVAAALAGFGESARYVTALPDNPLGHAALAHLRAAGIDVSGIRLCGERIGMYFLEKGAGLRPSQVVYDRRHSALSEVRAGDFDWDALLRIPETDTFFFTGITPAVGSGLPEVLGEALSVCRERGIRTACDLNYRPTLWTPEKARPVMQSLVEGLDLLVANEEHAGLLLCCQAPDDAADESERLRELAVMLCRTYGIRRVALTLRRSLTADDNVIAAAYYDSESRVFARSRDYAVRIVDRIGGGDAMTAGLLYAIAHDFTPADAVEFAAAANALKHSIPGDALLASANEVARLASSDGSVRMLR